MSLTIFKVEWFKKKTKLVNDYETNGVVLDQVLQVKISLEIGSREDSSTIQLSNSNQFFDNIDLDDKIDISISTDSGSSYTKTFTGIVSNKKIDLTINPNIYTITCVNLFEKFFKVLTPVSGVNVTKTADEYIRQVLGFVNDAHKGGLKIVGDDLSEWQTIGNPELSIEISYTSPLKAAHRILTELSSKQINKTNNYFMRLDNNNNFVWTALDRVTNTGTFTEGEDYSSLILSKGLKDIITQLIVICGPSPYNTSNILVNVHDDLAGAKYGVKARTYNPYESGSITEEMLIADRIKFDRANTGLKVPSSYPYQTAWNRTYNHLKTDNHDNLDHTSNDHENTVVVDSEEDYIDEFIAEARRRGQRLGEERLRSLVNPKWTASMTLDEPSLTFSLGGKYDIKSPQVAWLSSVNAEAGSFTKEFFLTGIFHTYDIKGWRTNLKFKQIDLEENIF